MLPPNTTLINGSDTVSVTLKTLGVQSLTATDVVSAVTGSEAGITVLPNSEIVGLSTVNLTTGVQQLVRFNAATPGQVTTIGTISGLASGQTMVAIAFRPATGGLYGIGYGSDAAQLYLINPTTAVATAVAAPFSTTVSGVDFGFSFDPTQDIARITTNANENFRVNPNTGMLISQDTILTPTSANVVGIAYNDNVAGAAATTLYGYNVANDNLVVVGTVGSATSSNGGVVTSVGPSGVTSAPGAAGETGFAIDANGAAYLNLDVGNSTTSTSGLYTVNLNTGAVAPNGTFETGITMRDIASVPATSYALGNLGATKIAGATSPVTVTAVDPYGNTALGYAGTVTFTSSDAAASLPPNTNLTYGSDTVNVTFNTIGAQSLTATDTASPQRHEFGRQHQRRRSGGPCRLVRRQ